MEAAINGKALLQQAAERQRALHAAHEESVPGLSTFRIGPTIEKAVAAAVEPSAEAVREAEEKAARAAKWEAESAQREREQYIESQRTERKRRIGLLEKGIGTKYITKDLSTREYYGDESDKAKQKSAFGRVEQFITNMRENVASGRNLLLVGSRGTGKDFCLANCLKNAIWRYGMFVRWMDGSRLFLNLRDSMNKHAAQTEAQIIHELSDFPIVGLSDPMPAMGNITEFQASVLLSIVDARYRADKPTWLTLNVASRKEAEQRMGAMLVDRLFENSEVIFFDWPSYREHARNKARES